MTNHCKTNLPTMSITADKPICNICRQDDKLENLLTPCACRDSIGFVHFKCVKIWIETTGTDVCAVCRKAYIKGLVIKKRSGRFGKFFHHSEMGRLYSQFTYFFLVMFYLSYLGQFHSRLAYQRGMVASAMVIAAFNAFYLLIHTVLFCVYLVMVYVSFLHWRKTHFDIEVNKNGQQQA